MLLPMLIQRSRLHAGLNHETFLVMKVVIGVLQQVIENAMNRGQVDLRILQSAMQLINQLKQMPVLLIDDINPGGKAR